MPIHHDTIGICPAILLPDPMRADDEAFERVVHAAADAGFTSFSLWTLWATSYGAERARARPCRRRIPFAVRAGRGR